MIEVDFLPPVFHIPFFTSSNSLGEASKKKVIDRIKIRIEIKKTLYVYTPQAHGGAHLPPKPFETLGSKLVCNSKLCAVKLPYNLFGRSRGRFLVANDGYTFESGSHHSTAEASSASIYFRLRGSDLERSTPIVYGSRGANDRSINVTIISRTDGLACS
ncbi:hypothetical protein EVAR_76944_1 [Eumeta japonica]|uniref:Uncharacterized protein n=1 Tax=Eumeta variegata TaxID=151549 RepID=A0A4C1SFN6_EUMVA|nr:hypothetical protein EVAR_76944_1 [Eumeta japonica]